MCDILLRLPLSIFVKLVHVTMDVPGLHDYLSHPVKKHLLIREDVKISFTDEEDCDFFQKI